MVQCIDARTVTRTFTNISFLMFFLRSILFWLGKDCAWNGLIPSMWIIFVLPTLLIACDFVFSSLFSEVSTCVRACTMKSYYLYEVLLGYVIISELIV